MAALVYGLVFRAKIGNSSQKLVLLALADNSNDNGKCFPGIGHISQKTELSKKQVTRIVDALAEKKLLSMEKGLGRGNETTFQLNLEAIRELVPNCLLLSREKWTSETVKVDKHAIANKEETYLNINLPLTREGRFAKFIQAHFEKRFKITCPWNGREGKTLKSLLADNPSWTDEQICQWIKNYFSSETAKPDRPGLWLSNLGRWSQGPLDAFGKVTLQNSVAAPKKPPSLPAGPLFQVGVN